MRIDQRAGIGHPPERDQQSGPSDELERAAQPLAVEAAAQIGEWTRGDCGDRHPGAPVALRPIGLVVFAPCWLATDVPRSSRRRADRSYIAHLLCFFRALAVG